MSVYHNLLLILTGLTGILSITTVREVSVQTGGSVSIPCLYDSKYINRVKYLCKGYYYFSCSYAVKTNQQNSGKFSISDNKSQRTFTVTINDVTNTDEHYWCVVEIDGEEDDRQYFHMSVTGGKPSLYVDNQEVTGFEDDDVTISCYYRNPRDIKWCKLGGSCVIKSSGSIDGTTVTIDASIPNVFTVTLSGLKMESSGWYYCVQGALQMPVHVAVFRRPSTSSTTSSLDVTSVSAGGESTADSGLLCSFCSPSQHLKIFSIRLSVLIFVVMVTLFIWFIVKRFKQKKGDSSDTAKAEGGVRYIRNTSGERSQAESDTVTGS